MREIKYLSRNSADAVFRSRPDDIIKVYVDENEKKIWSNLLKWCAQNRKAYHLVKTEDLNRLTESAHHQGICVLAKEKKEITFADFVKTATEQKLSQGTVLVLDGVENPHNLGAILRTAAHFGVTAILGDSKKMPKMSAAAHRVSEGAAEAIECVRYLNLKMAIADLHKLGFKVFSANGDSKKSLYETKFPKKTAFILGAEVEGVSNEALSLSDECIAIPGTGVVESLNVSAATAILLSEFSRQNLN